ncbi:MAG: low-complexity tail membrane protein [Cyanobacteria bacterium P01_D01_bin.105]
MIQFQQNRYLWVHFAALALVPLLLDVCLVGLASARGAFGYPSAYGFQFWAIALLCVGLPLWMQIARPFYIFSLPPVALNPDGLTEDQRRCLTVLTSWQIKALAGVAAVGCVWLLAQLYEKSALVTNPAIPLMTPAAGMVSVVVTFFLVSLLMQISVSAGRSLLVSPKALRRVAPYEGAIAQNFLIAGIRIDQLLPSEPLDSSGNELESTPESPLGPSTPQISMTKDTNSDLEIENGDQ